MILGGMWNVLRVMLIDVVIRLVIIYTLVYFTDAYNYIYV